MNHAEARLIAVGGLPGTGKSLVARRLAERFNALLLRTDVVRKEHYPQPTYTEAETQQVYADVLRRAARALDAGCAVVLDATFRRQVDRDATQQLAQTRGLPWAFILVVAPEALIAERMAQRRGDASDADFATHQLLKKTFDPVEHPHWRVDNAGSLTDLDRQLALLFEQL